MAETEVATRLPKTTIPFLAELSANNDKEWFEANRARFEAEVSAPIRAFVRAMAERLPSISPHIAADDRKSGGSMSRIHRDVRFSKDKAPYHDHVSVIFFHSAGKKMELPGFYVRFAPAGVTLGTGLHAPDPEKLAKIRRRIADRPEEWFAASSDKAFRKAWGGLQGESLSRPPAGFPKDHPAIVDLKRKDFTAFADLPAAAATRPDFADQTTARFAASAPLMRFLCTTLSFPF